MSHCLLPRVWTHYSVARSGTTAVSHVLLVMFCYCTPLNKDFWLNIFSSPGKNNCMCLFIAACNWTGNTIATPQRFFLNSHIGMNPRVFRRGKWDKENISLLIQVQRIYLSDPCSYFFSHHYSLRMLVLVSHFPVNTWASSLLVMLRWVSFSPILFCMITFSVQAPAYT